MAVNAFVIALGTADTGPFEHVATFDAAIGIAEIELGVVSDVIGETGMDRPGKASGFSSTMGFARGPAGCRGSTRAICNGIGTGIFAFHVVPADISAT